MTDTTDTRPSIAELQALRDEMAPGPFTYDEEHGCIETAYVPRHDQPAEELEVLVLGARNNPEDGEGAAAILTAAPVLLEIAAAALAWRDQRADNLRAALMRTEAEIEAEDQEVQRARVKRTADLARAIENALAKVRP